MECVSQRLREALEALEVLRLDAGAGFDFQAHHAPIGALQEKIHFLVEITLHGKNINMVATARTEGMYAAVDEAVEKLEKQLHKFLERLHDHRPHGEKNALGEELEAVEAEA